MSALLVMQLTLALLFAWALLSSTSAGPDRR
jgi:hypothetical protein